MEKLAELTQQSNELALWLARNQNHPEFSLKLNEFNNVHYKIQEFKFRREATPNDFRRLSRLHHITL